MNPDDGELESFLWWMCERQRMWEKKQRDELPLTDDPILKKWHFCNVHRELDSGTQYLLRIVEQADDTAQAELLNILVYRFFNRPRTHERIGGWLPPKVWRPEQTVQILRMTKERGETVFSPAYRVVTEDYGYEDKIGNILYGIIQDEFLPYLDEWTENLLRTPSLEWAHSQLQDLRGVGPFLAYELVTDLNYFWWEDLSECDFVNIGGGAEWGLELIFGTAHEDQVYWLHDRMDELFGEYGLEFPYWEKKSHLTLRDIEHSLCEWRKYRTIEKTGTGHRRYDPTYQDTFDTFV